MSIIVGDIVKTKNKEGKAIIPAVVTKVNMRKYYGRSDEELDSVEVLFADGTFGYRTAAKITKTGRHIDVQSILDLINF